MPRQAGHLALSDTGLTAYLECEDLVHLDVPTLVRGADPGTDLLGMGGSAADGEVDCATPGALNETCFALYVSGVGVEGLASDSAAAADRQF